MIVDQLMIRDLARSPEIDPIKRRKFLRSLALFLSKRDSAQITEPDFKDLIHREFKRDINRLPPDSRKDQLERFFADLRSSTTLTRTDESKNEGWKFSHNILREFLLAEYLIDGLKEGSVIQDEIPVSDAMKSFVSTLDADHKHELLTLLGKTWKSNRSGCGQLLSLLWDGLLSLFSGKDNLMGSCIAEITGQPADFNSIGISRISLSSESVPTNLSGSNFVNSNLSDINLSWAIRAISF